MLRKWCITVAVILVLGAAVLAGVRSVQHAKAASSAPLQLAVIWVFDSHFGTPASYHRGQAILLIAAFYDETGAIVSYTAHPAVYHNSYRLLNVAVPSTSSNDTLQQPQWQVTIPKNAPLGTYKFWFTLSVSGYPDQTVVTPFKVIK